MRTFQSFYSKDWKPLFEAESQKDYRLDVDFIEAVKAGYALTMDKLVGEAPMIMPVQYYLWDCTGILIYWAILLKSSLATRYLKEAENPMTPHQKAYGMNSKKEPLVRF